MGCIADLPNNIRVIPRWLTKSMTQIWYFLCFLIYRSRESFTDNILSHETIDTYQKRLHFQCLEFILIGHIFYVLLHCHQPEAFYQILTCLIRALWVHVTYLFTKCVKESCDSPDWLIQYFLSSASSRVTETVSMKMPCGECFQKCFSANNMISLWLNTVIPIIVMIWLPNMTRYLQWRIIYRHLTLFTF